MVCARNSNLRRITIPLILCSLAMLILSASAAAALPGSGTQEDPWRIESLAYFDEFAGDPNYWSGFTRLETDVNLAGRIYTSAVIAPDTEPYDLGFEGPDFNGVFDGNGHKIKGLTIEPGANNWYLALFGYIGDGEVRNLGIEGVSVVRGFFAVGALAGQNSGSISKCYSAGHVSGSNDVGGLVGRSGGSISNCYATGEVSGGGAGLVGSNWGSISNCYATGEVSGGAGLVGSNSGSISNCYARGSVSGGRMVGGLVGLNGTSGDHPGYIYNSYSSGNIEGTSWVGGLVGYNLAGEIEESFWDVETSGEPNMCGYQEEGYGAGCDPNYGKTTAEMQTQSTFTDVGWDFVDVWLINEGATYPVLRQEIRSDLNGSGGVDMADFAIFAGHWLDGKDD